MKHGTPVKFRTSLSGMIGRGHKLSDELGGVFLEFADTDESFCRILADKSKKIAIAQRRHVKFKDTFYGESDGCGYCGLHQKARDKSKCTRGEKMLFVRCGVIGKTKTKVTACNLQESD